MTPALLLHDFAKGNSLALGLLQQQIKPEVLHQAVPALANATEVFSCGVHRMYPAAVHMDYTLSQIDTRCHVCGWSRLPLSLLPKLPLKQSTLPVIGRENYSDHGQ